MCTGLYVVANIVIVRCRRACYTPMGIVQFFSVRQYSTVRYRFGTVRVKSSACVVLVYMSSMRYGTVRIRSESAPIPVP